MDELIEFLLELQWNEECTLSSELVSVLKFDEDTLGGFN
jgi:hypothetical protein